MKLYFLLFFPIIVSAQSIEENIRNQACICLNEKANSSTFDLSKCIKNIIIKNQTEIEEHLKNKILDSTDYQKRYKLGYNYISEFLESNQKFFLKNCVNYFNAINNTRKKGINISITKSCSSEKKARITKSINESEYNAVFIRDRSICYLANEQYELALTDLNNLISKDSTDYHSYFLKAWGLEKTKRYSEASEIYFKLYKITKNKRFKVLGEITEILNNQE